jgi:hypothetical protein
MVSQERSATCSFFWFLAVCSSPVAPLTLVKIAGDSLLLEVYTGESTSIEVATWGLILSQLGFYPLLNATFSFIHTWFRLPKIKLITGSPHGNAKILL